MYNSGMLEYIKRFFLRKTDSSESIFSSWRDSGFDGEKLFSEKWILSDNLETYNKVGNKNYGEDDISYHINVNGFRIPEENYTDSGKTIACFGCSNTFGVGVRWEETWPFLLNENLGNDYVVKNYAVSGGSNDLICRLVHNYTLKNSPKAICCFFPEIYRIELIEPTQDYMLSFAQHLYKFTFIDKNYRELNVHESFIPFFKSYQNVFTEKNCVYNFIKNYKFIESICRSNNIDFYWSSWSDFILNMGISEVEKNFNSSNYVHVDGSMLNIKEKARDNHHNGLDFNKKLSDKFADKIKLCH